MSTKVKQEPQVTITSDFWKRYRELIVKEVLPYQWAVMNDEAEITIADDPQKNGSEKNSHAIANLKIAAGQLAGNHYGFPFQDTDVYKWLEAAAYSFQYHPDPDLQKITDDLIDLIAQAQEEDGYLSTYFQIEAMDRQFKRLQQSHELYTMGHYIEAGVVYYQATGNQKALTIAQKMADCLDANFGKDEGKIPGYDGHPEVELALVRLYEETGITRYLNLAHFFLVERGQDPDFFDKQNKADGEERDLIAHMREFPRSYYQAEKPLAESDYLTGHAVRVVYLCTGMAYVARHTGNRELLAACQRFWQSIVKRRMYITGNIGSTTVGESFTYDYDLPNDTDYGETCASVGLSFFAQQMLALEAKGEYGDVLEKELFNGTLSGMSLYGKHFFYVNPLEADPEASKGNPGKGHILTERADWFGCACCPANLARLVASVDRYIYTEKADVLLSHQFIANEATFSNGVRISQTNQFPWEGTIQYAIENPSATSQRVGIRLPAWSKQTSVQLNGEPVDYLLEDGFVYFDCQLGQTAITLELDMTVRFMRSNNRNAEDYNKVAIQRGPVIYAVEEIDNQGPLWLYQVDTKQDGSYQFEAETLGGVGIVRVQAQRPQLETISDELYQEDTAVEQEKVELTCVPYYAWANRGANQMRVWLNKL